MANEIRIEQQQGQTRKLRTLEGETGYVIGFDADGKLAKIASAEIVVSEQELPSPIIADGLTASGSDPNDFSASTGTFKTSSGANTLSGDVTLAAGKDFTVAAGDTAFDASLGTGVFKTSSGVNTISGTVSLAANKNVACVAGTTAIDWSLGTGVTKTTTGTNTLGGNTIFKLIATPVAATGAGGGVAGAAALGAGNFLTVSSDGATKGVKLLTGVAGDVKWILNTSSTACNLFAASGGTINGGAGDAGCAIPLSKGVLAICTAADTWTVFDMTAHAGAAA